MNTINFFATFGFPIGFLTALILTMWYKSQWFFQHAYIDVAGPIDNVLKIKKPYDNKLEIRLIIDSDFPDKSDKSKIIHGMVRISRPVFKIVTPKESETLEYLKERAKKENLTILEVGHY